MCGSPTRLWITFAVLAAGCEARSLPPTVDPPPNAGASTDSVTESVDKTKTSVDGTKPAPVDTAEKGCVKIEDGGPTSCKDSATWKQYGAEACAQQKLVLTDLAFGTSCAPDRFVTVVYVCCPEMPTGGMGGASGSDLTCTAETLADGRVCKTCVDANGKVVASDCAGGAGTPGTGGTSGSDLTCTASTSPEGATCKTCTNADGKVVYAECQGGNTGATDICDVRTNADGTQCKTCWHADGTMTSSCPTPPPKS